MCRRWVSALVGEGLACVPGGTLAAFGGLKVLNAQRHTACAEAGHSGRERGFAGLA